MKYSRTAVTHALTLRGLLAASALVCATSALAAPQPGTIRWDRYGVPHIYGADIQTVVRGLGYAQMENHAETALNNVARSRGRSAEYFGPGPNNFNINYDMKIRTYGIPARAAQWVANGGAFQQQVLQAFCAGINEYATRHPDDILPELKPILPVVPSDITAGEQSTIWFTFLPETSGVPGQISNWLATGNVGAAAAKAAPAKLPIGSNGWAVGPSKSTSGNAILMGNPHLPWGVNMPVGNSDANQNFGIYQWIEANLIIGDPAAPSLNASGVTFIGGPFIGIGFSDYVGWTHTNNTIKNADLYELTLDSTGTKYLFGGVYLPLTHRVETYQVKQADGSLAPQTLDIYGSIHGPVVAFNPAHSKALALRIPGLSQSSLVTQYWDMIQAKNVTQFKSAESRLQMPFFNTMYADRDGHTFYLFGGQQPVRHGGAIADYAGILNGSDPTQLWTSTLTFNQLPQATNPASGFIANSNNPPWNSVIPAPASLDPANFPAWVAPQTMAFRPQHGTNFLLSQPKFTATEILAGKMSTRMLLADRVLPDLLIATALSGNATATAAAGILSAWDRTADAASVGGALFEEWWNLVVADVGAGNISADTSLVFGYTYPKFRMPRTVANQLSTPNGLDPVNNARLVADLATAYDNLQTRFAATGGASTKWGDVHKTTLVDRAGAEQTLTFPFAANSAQSGTEDVFGPLRVVNSTYIGILGEYISYGGDGYVQVIEFTPNGAVGGTLLTYGNASRPNSKHVTDQLPFFDSKTLKPALRTLSAVQSATVKTEGF